jgi:DNA-binding transcriptional ArsR family regulator
MPPAGAPAPAPPHRRRGDPRRAAGRTVGEWIDRALAKAAEEALHPKPPAATREDVAEVVREQLAPVIARLEALEEKADQTGAARAPLKRADVGPARAAVQKAMGRPQRRGLPEEVRARIGELHRAGRSAYAISRELGVSYNAVRTHLRALEEAG